MLPRQSVKVSSLRRLEPSRRRRITNTFSDWGGCLTLIFFVLLIAAGSIGFTLLQGALLNDDIPVRTVSNAGYTDISQVSKDIWFVQWKGGHKDDVALYTLTARNPAGAMVTVEVYLSAWPWSSATIRGR